jgi:deoxyribonuclease V
MIAAVDVHYVAGSGCAGCVTFADWADSKPQREYVTQRRDVHEYQPGEFWKRELPCLLAALDTVDVTLQTVVIDRVTSTRTHARGARWCATQ